MLGVSFRLNDWSAVENRKSSKKITLIANATITVIITSFFVIKPNYSIT
jgi:hypothetical protein